MRHASRLDRWRFAALVAGVLLLVGGVLVGGVLAWPRVSALVRSSAAAQAPGPGDGTTVFVVGDAQTGCSLEAGCGPETFVAQAGADLGWTVRYLGGVGYLDESEPFAGQALLVAAYQPDLVLLSGGLADRGAGAALLRAEVASTVADLKAAAPAAEVIVLGPAWESARAVPSDVARAAAAIAAGAADAGAALVLDPVGEQWFRGSASASAAGGTGTSSNTVGVLSVAGHRTVATHLVTRVPPALAVSAVGSRTADADAAPIADTTAAAGDPTPNGAPSGAPSGASSGPWEAASPPAGTDQAPAVATCVPVVAARRTLLPVPADVTIDVANSGGQAGLAARTAQALADRGFVIDDLTDDDPEAAVDAAAEIRFGPRGRAAARLLQAYVPGAVLVRTDRPGRSVELAVTDEVTRLAAPRAVAAFLDRRVVVRPCP